MRVLGDNTQTCFHDLGESSLEVYYDASTGDVHYTATVASGQYIALGYGTNMHGTDMVAWIYDGTASQQQDLYSSQEQPPTVLSSNAYTTVIASTNATHTVFDSSRPLTPTEGDTYVIPLNEAFSTVWAFEATSRLAVEYHNEHRGTILMTLPSTGGCQLGAATAPSYPQATLHGVFMWFAWSVISLGQLCTNRYAKHWWKHR